MFLDYNMPGLNGMMLSEIKRQYPRTGVVIMTSTQDEAVAERARIAGAAAFLKKPFYAADIDAVLNSVYGLRTSRSLIIGWSSTPRWADQVAAISVCPLLPLAGEGVGEGAPLADGFAKRVPLT